MPSGAWPLPNLNLLSASGVRYDFPVPAFEDKNSPAFVYPALPSNDLNAAGILLIPSGISYRTVAGSSGDCLPTKSSKARSLVAENYI